MKKPTSYMLMACVLTILISFACAKKYEMDIDKSEIITLARLKTEPSLWQDIQKDVENGEDAVIHIKEGDSLPLKLDLDMPMVSLIAGENNIKFNKDVYVYISKGRLKVSPDGENWSDIHKAGDMKKLFGMKKGEISFGFAASEDEGTFLSIGMKSK